MTWINAKDIKRWYETKATIVADVEIFDQGVSKRTGIVGVMDFPPNAKYKVVSINGETYYAFTVDEYDPVKAAAAIEVAEELRKAINEEINLELLFDLDIL